jgi:hypothetical protein
MLKYYGIIHAFVYEPARAASNGIHVLIVAKSQVKINAI